MTTDMATDVPEYSSDSSDLTEVPDLITDEDNVDLNMTQLSGETWSSSSWEDLPESPRSIHSSLSRLRKKRPSPILIKSIMPDLVSPRLRRRVQHEIQQPKRSDVKRGLPLSPIEMLPNEIIQKIATAVDSDRDYYNLNLSSPTFPTTINQHESEVWRKKFLAKYDHPIIGGPYEFSIAYKLRRLVLKNFIDFTHGLNRRTEIQLEILLDMILETYNNPKPWEKPSVISRNLRAFESPNLCPWILKFLSIPFPGISDKKRWGEPNSLFETIQLVLSHLVLSPTSALSHQATTSRTNYDLVRVYNYNQPFTTLYTLLSNEEPPIAPFQSTIFPNLRSPRPKPPSKRYKLDTTSLLHIRNFWHRHLIDDSYPVGEHTYADMMKDLTKLGKTPKRWEKALDSEIVIPTQWFGHYSCVHPWPKARINLEEQQSFAEDWDHVDPMMLDLLTTNDYRAGFWPPAFSSIPAFQTTIPEPPNTKNGEAWFHETNVRSFGSAKKAETNHYFPRSMENPVYIRGIAPFINTNNRQSTQASSTTPASAEENYLKFHPFTSLRIRGVIHDIPAGSTVDNTPNAREKAIPGWKRIVMIMYKPNISYLINVLEHAAEDYGGVFGTQVTNILNTANIWGAGAGAGGTPTTTNPSSTASTSTTATTAADANPASTITVAATTTTTTTTDNTQTQTQTQPQSVNPIPLSPTDLLKHLQTRLHALLKSETTPFPLHHPPSQFPSSSTSSQSPPFPSHAARISTLEDAFTAPNYLAWDDGSIDFAYAYEGVVLPGGKIMLGRWWRCHGVFGGGEGCEVTADGEGVGMELDGDGEGQGGGDGGGGEGEGEGDGDTVNNANDAMDVDGNENPNVNTNTNESTRHRYRYLERGPFVFWC